MSISSRTIRLTLLPIVHGKPAAIPDNGSLVRTDWGPPVATLRSVEHESKYQCGELHVSVSPDPLVFTVTNDKDQIAQRLRVDDQSGVISFLTGDAPLLGLGEGGQPFDRRGSVDEMRSGQGGYELHTHGGRFQYRGSSAPPDGLCFSISHSELSTSPERIANFSPPHQKTRFHSTFFSSVRRILH